MNSSQGFHGLAIFFNMTPIIEAPWIGYGKHHMIWSSFVEAIEKPVEVGVGIGGQFEKAAETERKRAVQREFETEKCKKE